MRDRPLPFLLLVVALILLAGCAGRSSLPTAETAPHAGYKVGSPYQINGVWYYPAEDFSYDETGIASWYGADFHGKYTANGEVYDLNALTAAHRTLPMPSIVQVINLDNGRSIELRVNDRGPYARNRIIDVSRRAAQLLGFEGVGTAKVRVKILVPESIQAASLARRNGGNMAVAEALPAVPRDSVTAVPLVPTPTPATRIASRERVPLSPSPPPAVTMASWPETVTAVPVRPTQIYIQAGAFARADNALRAKSRLDPLGRVTVTGLRINGMDLYRVRLGPIPTVEEADKLLDGAAAAGLPEARIVID